VRCGYFFNYILPRDDVSPPSTEPLFSPEHPDVTASFLPSSFSLELPELFVFQASHSLLLRSIRACGLGPLPENPSFQRVRNSSPRPYTPLLLPYFFFRSFVICDSVTKLGIVHIAAFLFPSYENNIFVQDCLPVMLCGPIFLFIPASDLSTTLSLHDPPVVVSLLYFVIYGNRECALSISGVSVHLKFDTEFLWLWFGVE